MEGAGHSAKLQYDTAIQIPGLITQSAGALSGAIRCQFTHAEPRCARCPGLRCEWNVSVIAATGPRARREEPRANRIFARRGLLAVGRRSSRHASDCRACMRGLAFERDSCRGGSRPQTLTAQRILRVGGCDRARLDSPRTMAPEVHAGERAH